MSSVLSQGNVPRDRGSTGGSATSSVLSRGRIPRDQVPAAGAATRSGFSQGRASWMWWQSRDDQGAESMDAMDGETAEVKHETKETN